MNGREKIEAAFTSEGTPEFGAVICYEGIYIRDHWSHLTDLPWWYAQSPSLEHQMAWRRQVIPAIGQDWMYLPSCPSRVYRREHLIREEGSEVFLLNQRTGQKKALKKPSIGGWEILQLGYSGHVENPPLTPEEVEQRIPPAQPFDANAYRDQGHQELAEQLLQEFGTEHYPFVHVSSPLWVCYHLWGFEGMMTMIAENPELVRFACQRQLQHELMSVHEAAALGANGVFIEECMTDMISPAAYENLNLPYLRALAEEIHTCGMHSIYYYCGNPGRRLDLLLASGADALSLEESKKGFTIDIDQLADAIQGRCVLFGNLDAINLLPRASESELRAEIKRQLAAGRRNKSRFVMSIGSPVTPETTPERVRCYCQIVHESGR